MTFCLQHLHHPPSTFWGSRMRKGGFRDNPHPSTHGLKDPEAMHSILQHHLDSLLDYKKMVIGPGGLVSLVLCLFHNDLLSC